MPLSTPGAGPGAALSKDPTQAEKISSSRSTPELEHKIQKLKCKLQNAVLGEALSTSDGPHRRNAQTSSAENLDQQLCGIANVVRKPFPKALEISTFSISWVSQAQASWACTTIDILTIFSVGA